MQIKSDVSGCIFEVPALNEATLLGAALVAGIGCGLFKNETEARSSMVNSPGAMYHPSPSNHRKYRQLYKEGYLALQAPIRDFSARISSTSFTSKG
jgi:xylulokinase